MSDSAAQDPDTSPEQSVTEADALPEYERSRELVKPREPELSKFESANDQDLTAADDEAGIADEEPAGRKPVGNKKPISRETTARFQAPPLSTIYDGKPFSELVKTWETYIGDNAAGQFQPLLNNICGAGQNLARLGYAAVQSGYVGVESTAKLSEPVPLRHIRSTPLVQTPSILDDDEDEPPPIGLEILSRSRSTPLSTSANSAFGTILRPNLPYIGGPDDRSAFTLPPYRLKPSLSQESVNPHHTIFNPIKCDNELETSEETAIEVMDLPSVKPESPGETGAEAQSTSRAARFLSDVRNLRMRRRPRDGRENPARPVSISEELSGSKSENSGDEETLSSKSSTNTTETNTKKGDEGGINRGSNTKQEINNSLDANAYPNAILSSDDHHLEDGCQNTRGGRVVRIQVSCTKPTVDLPSDAVNYPASPVPSHLGHESSTLTPQSHDSPEASRSSGTTYTSGHTTQGTATTYSSGQTSNLSVISETDLEVMRANKAGKLIQSGRVAPAPSTRQHRYPGYIEVSDSPNSLREGASVPAERFFTLADSPGEKRLLGARLRTASSLRRSSTTASPNTVSSASMTTNSSASSHDEPPTFVSYLDKKLASDLTLLREMDERSSPRDTVGGAERESSPAEILGYSDMTFEEAQAPTGRPGSRARPRPVWPTKGFQFGRKVRSLPPRSPHKGLRTPSTPPPRGGGASPVYDAISPPRHIVDHRIDPNVSKPYVFRSTPPSTRLLASHKVSPEVLLSSHGVHYAHIPDGRADQCAYEVVRMGTNHEMPTHYYVTQSRGTSPNAYNEQSIEVLKADSKEESSPTFVTPAKGS